MVIVIPQMQLDTSTNMNSLDTPIVACKMLMDQHTVSHHAYSVSSGYWMIRNKCIATSNKCLTSSNKKLVGAKGLTTRSKDATRGSCPY